MTHPGLRDFLGTDYESEPLKPIGLRVRNALKPWLIRQPQRAMSRLIETTDGRRFKLLEFGPSIADKRRAIEARLEALAPLDCVPARVWSDDRGILVDWVEGETPRADDPVFARRLGEAFAELYRIDLTWRPKETVVGGLFDRVHQIFESGRLPSRFERILEKRLLESLPDSIPTSLLCGDQTLANFVLTPDGGLSMIDPGSFQPDLPIDIFFVAGLYLAIDRAAFHEAYAHAEGIDFPFVHRDALQLFQLARATALQARVLDATPRIEIRRRSNLRRSVEAKLARLYETLEGSTS